MTALEQLANDVNTLPDILTPYENDIVNVADIIKFDRSQLNRANYENSSWLLHYDQKRVELHGMVKFMEMYVKNVRSKLYVSYTQTHNRDLTEAGKEKYIDGEPKFHAACELSLTVKEVYEKYQSICSAIQARGYAINNATKLAIAEIEDVPY